VNDYTGFQETADGTRFPDRVVNVQKVEVPARSLSGPANLYLRVTGTANFDLDPDLMEGWRRGTLAVVCSEATTPSGHVPLFGPDDTVLEASATAALRALLHEEEGPTDDWGIALDGVSSVTADARSGALVVSIQTAYRGDAWVKRVGFAADFAIHRPALDNFLPDHHVRFALEDLLRSSTVAERPFSVG
jgi:hypothetical protein